MSKELATQTKPLWKRLTEAAQTISGQFPEVAKLLEQTAKQDIVVLGESEIFTLRDGQGEIRSFKQAMTFSSAAGTLVQPVPGGPLVVSAQGYENWAECAGASVIFPKEVLVDGQWKENPAVIRDTQNRRILCIYARAVAFRFTSNGIPQESDWSTIFDTPSYRMIDLLGKAKKFPQAFRLYPNDMDRPKDAGTWAGYPFDESTCLWVNTAHDEALSWFAQILNREKKAIDFAQTFAKRNALKHLSGLQKAPSDNWRVPVICWCPTSGTIIKWDATQYANLRETVGNLISSRGNEFGEGQLAIEQNAGVERTSDEDGFEEIEKTTDPEDQVIDVEPAKQEQASSESGSLDKKLLANLLETKRQFPGEYRIACRQLKLQEDGYYSAKEMEAIMDLIKKILL